MCGRRAAPAFGQALAPGDAISVDPDVHSVILENDHLRVFDARASKGTKSPMHSHPPILLVSLDWMRLKLALPDGKAIIHDFSPSQVLWLGAGGGHSREALAGGGRVIAIEVKSVAQAES